LIFRELSAGGEEMRLTLIITTIAFSLLAGPASAGNKIDLYSDAARSSCELTDQSAGPALEVVYVFMTGPEQSTGVRFKAARPACWVGASFVGNVSNYLTIGTTEVDYSVGFGACIQPPIMLGQINFVGTGLGGSCCEMTASPGFEFVHTDCNFAEHAIVAGQKLVINPTAACRCQSPVAVEPSSWGRVKSLYR
jgi:hypothetical protein